MNLFALLLRLTVSLGVVLVLVRVAANLLQRSTGGLGRRRGPAQVEVLLRQPVGKRASISVVRAGDRALLLGVTDHAITLLAEDDPDVLVPFLPASPRTATALATPAPAAAIPARTSVVDALRERTIRRV